MSESDKTETPTSSTPGRPHDRSRQQKHDDQKLESGSAPLDRGSGSEPGATAPKPPGAK
jgi:hypothetical protein